ncbi:hypothetical protein IFM89_017336 [Coptis chinensis]|uniref:Nuclear transcription factor Y subunit n=1 Tax=Coptis chinensis TaxID=261450 RepID=A0A835LMJ8_9MAGN|nr:hypothetical protein IFM89_017336 [Coptis chinensis]
MRSSPSCQPWWQSVGYNSEHSVEMGDSVLKPDGSMETQRSKSQSDGVRDEGDIVSKEAQTTSVPESGGAYLVPHTEPELVGHSIVTVLTSSSYLFLTQNCEACAPYPYSDPYYGGLMNAYGPQALSMHHSRMPLPLDITEEPVYVNPKQYNGIMRRRQSRAKAELEKKLIKVRKPYLHESRHQHAIKRQRGCGGRFLNTKKVNHEPKLTPEEGIRYSNARSTESASPTASATTTQSTVQCDASHGKEDVDEQLMKRDMTEPHTYSKEDGIGNSCYKQQQDFRLSAFQAPAGERGEEGDCSGQLRGSISVRPASHRALTIQ